MSTRPAARRHTPPAGTGPGRAAPPRLTAGASATARAAAGARRHAAVPTLPGRTSTVVVGDIGDLTLRRAPGGGALLAARGASEAPLRAASGRHPSLAPIVVRRGDASGLVLRAGTSSALVIARGPARTRDARVRLAAAFLRGAAASHVDVAAPDLWSSPLAGTVLAEAVADTADTVRAGAATFDLSGRDGVGTWRVFAGVCVPAPAAYAGGTGARP